MSKNRFDATRVARMKAALRRLLPKVQSSHLSEALAAALGFRTAIALKTALRKGPIELVSAPDAHTFSATLGKLSSLSQEAISKAFLALPAELEESGDSTRILPRRAREHLYAYLEGALGSGLTLEEAMRVLALETGQSHEREAIVLREACGVAFSRASRGLGVSAVLEGFIPFGESEEIGTFHDLGMSFTSPSTTARGGLVCLLDARLHFLDRFSGLLKNGLGIAQALSTMERWYGPSHPTTPEGFCAAMCHAALVTANSSGPGSATTDWEAIGMALRTFYPFSEWMSFSHAFRVDGNKGEMLADAARRLQHASGAMLPDMDGPMDLNTGAFLQLGRRCAILGWAVLPVDRNGNPASTERTEISGRALADLVRSPPESSMLSLWEAEFGDMDVGCVMGEGSGDAFAIEATEKGGERFEALATRHFGATDFKVKAPGDRWTFLYRRSPDASRPLPMVIANRQIDAPLHGIRFIGEGERVTFHGRDTGMEWLGYTPAQLGTASLFSSVSDKSIEAFAAEAASMLD